MNMMISNNGGDQLRREQAPTRTKTNLKNPLFVQIQEEKHISRNAEPTAMTRHFVIACGGLVGVHRYEMVLLVKNVYTR